MYTVCYAFPIRKLRDYTNFVAIQNTTKRRICKINKFLVALRISNGKQDSQKGLFKNIEIDLYNKIR